jgi:hypothetical protein
MINIKSMPFDSKLVGADYDRAINSKEFARYLQSFVTNGVIVSGQNIIDTELKVTNGGGLVVNVATGAIHINGRVGWRDSDLDTLALDAGGTLDRIDRIVMELNATEEVRSIILKVVKGIENANPVPENLIRTEDIYQLSLAQCRVNAGAAIIASITDERPNKDVCGLANMFIGTTGYEADYVMLDSENITNYELELEVPENKNVQMALKKIVSFFDNIWETVDGIVNGTIAVGKAAILGTSRTINGVSFNGSANITITAAANGGTSAACSGNALTATTLQTARTINGVSFNGSANITITDSTKAAINHASTGTGHGVGTTANYGHVKLANNLTTAAYTDGVALAANQGKVLDDKIALLNFAFVRTLSIDLSLGSAAVAIPASDFVDYDEFKIVVRGTFSATSSNSNTDSFFIMLRPNSTITTTTDGNTFYQSPPISSSSPMPSTPVSVAKIFRRNPSTDKIVDIFGEVVYGVAVATPHFTFYKEPYIAAVTGIAYLDIYRKKG